VRALVNLGHWVHERPSYHRHVNIKQVALRLGVHYTTAYRWVRTHQLEADRTSTGWEVSESQLRRFEVSRRSDRPTRRRRVDWAERMRPALERGDEVAAWRVLEDALRSGLDPEACYLDVLVVALQSLPPDGDPVDGYLAATVAERIVARLGARFRRPGRTRGTVVVATPQGEQHSLSTSILADLVRLRGAACVELGAEVPPDVVLAAARAARSLRLVALGVSGAVPLDGVAATTALLHERIPGVMVLVGGPGVLNDHVAELIGADRWASDLRGAVTVIDEALLTESSGRTPSPGERV